MIMNELYIFEIICLIILQAWIFIKYAVLSNNYYSVTHFFK